jgi:hypothetical protein
LFDVAVAAGGDVFGTSGFCWWESSKAAKRSADMPSQRGVCGYDGDLQEGRHLRVFSQEFMFRSRPARRRLFGRLKTVGGKETKKDDGRSV